MSGAITALVVEDHDLVRVVTVEALTNAGIQVIEAANADLALVILNQQAASVHVLVPEIASIRG